MFVQHEPTIFDALGIVRPGWPPDVGLELARRVLERGVDQIEEIDVRHVPSSMLVSGFFAGFLQGIYDGGGDEVLEKARKILWKMPNKHSLGIIEQQIQHFSPERRKED